MSNHPNPKPTDYRAQIGDTRDWYAKRARVYRAQHIVLQTCLLLVSAAIPILAMKQWTFTTAIAGGVVTIVGGLANLLRPKDHWRRYRGIAELLRSELRRFDHSVLDYSGSTDRLALLAGRVEPLIDQERSEWLALQETESAKDKGRAQADGKAPAPAAPAPAPNLTGGK